MPFRTLDKHSSELGAKILELGKLLNEKLADSPKATRAAIVQSLYDMGPACLFDDMENEDEAKGAMKALDWIMVQVRAVK